MSVVSEPLKTLRKVTIAPRLIEDYRPLTESLEWRLSELYWNTAGTTGFVQSEIPYSTSSGALSANAARLLFANCREHPAEGALEVLEIGAGTGLFARLLLLEFTKLCEAEGKDYHRQLRYYVTDPLDSFSGAVEESRDFRGAAGGDRARRCTRSSGGGDGDGDEAPRGSARGPLQLQPGLAAIFGFCARVRQAAEELCIRRT